MTARIGVVTFPGTLDDRDTQRAVRVAGGEAVPLWHRDKDIKQVDAVVLPGGFSYGDYLRAGAISRFSPVMETIIEQARGGMPVLGICNGFQVLTEAHLLPGAMLRNNNLHFVCRDQKLRVETGATAWTADYSAGQQISIPLKNIDGRYTADEHTLDELEAEGRVVFRYAAGPTADGSGGGSADGYGNPNGSLRDIAGISNAAGNVVGLMPHPEHAVEPLIGTGRSDGLGFFTSVLKKLVDA
ncbi:MAG: phosphoribosylformylglycinamidine synthase subunit PurQ / glutaminase [Streptomyces sp.]|nr:phosphoribosylformylglycinamidine synthase subunit PurQ / glutaminase [Streptomyces sp.]